MKMGHGNAKYKGMAAAADVTARRNGHAMGTRKDGRSRHAMAENSAPIGSQASG